MTLPKISANRLLIIALIIVAVVGYYIFMSGGDEEAVSTETVVEVPTIGQELVIELNRLKALQNIDDKIFADPVFSSLKDFTQPVVPQPLGRSNPFAPIGSDL